MIVALCAAIGHEVPEAVEEALRREEMRAMQVADLQSYIAQRHFTENLQLPRQPRARLTTWQSAYRGLWNVLTDIRDGLGRAIAYLRWDRIGDAEAVLARLEYEAELGGDEDDGGDADSYVSHMDNSDTSSQPAEAPNSGARSELDEPMSDEELAEGDMQM